MPSWHGLARGEDPAQQLPQRDGPVKWDCSVLALGKMKWVLLCFLNSPFLPIPLLAEPVDSGMQGQALSPHPAG